MKTFGSGLWQRCVKHHTDWRIRQLRGQLENNLETILSCMYDAARQISMLRNCRDRDSLHMVEEARKAIESGIATMQRVLPVCSREYSRQALDRLEVIIARMW